MAQKVTVEHVDDLDDKSPADETGVRFGLDGVDYEIDLSAANAQQLRDILDEYVAVARRIGGRRQHGASPKISTTIPANGHTRPDAKAVREWAAKHGVQLSPRGRIPKGIEERYLNDNA